MTVLVEAVKVAPRRGYGQAYYAVRFADETFWRMMPIEVYLAQFSMVAK